MSITYNENSIIIKKLLKSKEIAYSDIRSVVLSSNESIITTKLGEIIKYKDGLICDRKNLYRAIKKLNIYFRNEDELSEVDNLYSIDEISKKISENQEYVKEYAGNLIRQELGPEYDINLYSIDVDDYIEMCFDFTKNGEIIKDNPGETQYSVSTDPSESFDGYVVAFLLEWDGNGKYGITEELKYRESCEKYINQSINCFVENYRNNC